MSTNPEIRLGVYSLTYEYSGHRVVDEVSFELQRGEILSLLGPNGSGKSTMLKAIAGLLPLSSGASQVRHQGVDFLSQPLARRAQQVAYVGADLRAEFPMTAHQAVTLGRSCQGGGLLTLVSKADQEAVRDAMMRCSCWEFRERDLHTLSSGERQLVALARALAQGAKTLLLDESLSRMDLHHQAAVGRLLTQLTQQNYSVIMVSHDINVASEWATKALLLKAGKRVGYGSIREMLTEQNLRALYPGSGLVVRDSPVSGAPKVFFAPTASI